MGDMYQIWTLQISRSKKTDRNEIHLLDTTAKSGIREFAPAWNDVMRYKDGYLSKEQYTDIYLRKMRDSQTSFPSMWKRLLEHKKVAVMCYCTPGKFCHRHLFVPLMAKYLEERGHTVQLMGELNGSQYQPDLEIPESVVSNSREKQIIPFYSADDPLSNHSRRGFTIKGIKFAHSEQFIMYCKAKLMGDHAKAAEILIAHHPQQCKILGREVTPYDERLWSLKRRPIAVRGAYQKAIEHPEIKEYLLSTGNAILVEASKSDKLWGVGIAKDDPRIYDPSQWQGLNLCGEVWMEVRRKLQEDVVF